MLLIVAKRGAAMVAVARRCRRLLEPVSPSAARFSPVLYFAKHTKIVQKKPRSCAVEPEPSSPPRPPAPLSPEQLDRIARNKRAALQKLTSVQTPPGFGESWRNGLSAEFAKPYFKQVRGPADRPRAASSVAFERFQTTSTVSHS